MLVIFAHFNSGIFMAAINLSKDKVTWDVFMREVRPTLTGMPSKDRLKEMGRQWQARPQSLKEVGVSNPNKEVRSVLDGSIAMIATKKSLKEKEKQQRARITALAGSLFDLPPNNELNPKSYTIQRTDKNKKLIQKALEEIEAKIDRGEIADMREAVKLGMTTPFKLCMEPTHLRKLKRKQQEAAVVSADTESEPTTASEPLAESNDEDSEVEVVEPVAEPVATKQPLYKRRR